MHVLSRRENQSIRIHTTDGIVKILITKLDDRLVKLAFDASDSMTIFRSEIDVSIDHYVSSVAHESLNRAQQKPVVDGLNPYLANWVEPPVRDDLER